MKKCSISRACWLCVCLGVFLVHDAAIAAVDMIAEYHLDETSWNGSVSDLFDSANFVGGPLNGRAIGSPIPSAGLVAPARSGSLGTCGYATLSGPASNGGAFSTSSLPVSTLAGAKTTVSFWMYWNGGNNMMPIGWNIHDLWLMSGFFGFNTGNSDIYGISSSGLANGWHHVVATFTNGNVTQNELYIDGVKNTLTQRLSTPNASTAVVSPTLRISGWARDNSYRFSGRIDEVKVFNGLLTQTIVTALFNEAHDCSSLSLIAEYRMDESAWNGTTNEVLDNSGSFSGTSASLNSTKPTTASATPAILGSLGTCRYGIFERANKDYAALPSSFPNLGASGSAFTITAWIKTTNNTMSGQRIMTDDENNTGGYGFSVGDGETGALRFYSRGTPSALLLDTANVIANNTWYFVAAVIDIPNKTKHIYVYNAAGEQLAYVNKSWTEASFGSDLGVTSIGGETNSATERSNAFGFAGNIDEVRVYQAALDVTALTLVRQSTHTCSAVGVSIMPANFNGIESSASASAGHLYTKLAGSPFSFEVVALKADGSVETGYAANANKNVTVELVDGSGTTACASRAALSPAASQTLAFTAADQGRKAITPIILGKAYPNLRCRVTDANQTPSVVACSTDNFAARPSGFTVTSSVNADAAGLSNSAAPALKTGAVFALSAASGVAGYSNTPSLDVSKVNAHAGAAQVGVLAGSFGNADATTGIASASAFTYSEVGYFNLASTGVYDDSFTAVDSAVNDCTADFSNVAVGGKVGCKFGNTAATTYFGRFIPDHFALTPGSVMPACNSLFTYFGQDGFSTLFTLKAQNSGNSTTQNYQGGLARLGLASWSVFNFSAASLPAGSVLSASATAPVGVWSQGLADVTAKHQLSKSTSAAAETSVVVKAAPIDSDGVTMTPATVAAGTPLRYGRLLLQNALGTELMALPVSLTAQFWNGSAFVLNDSDSCTTVTAPSSGAGLTFYPEVASTFQGNHLSAAETAATASATGRLVAGDAQLKFSAPGASNDGYLDLTIQAPNWLTFDWDSTTPGEEMPKGRATFGIYKGNDRQIYFREVY